jgi:hypothetical protein
MKFWATFSRGDRAFPVSGEVKQKSDGSWVGFFSFSMDYAPNILPGPAELTLRDGAKWLTFVTKTTTTDAEQTDAGMCEFNVKSGIP